MSEERLQNKSEQSSNFSHVLIKTAMAVTQLTLNCLVHELKNNHDKMPTTDIFLMQIKKKKGRFLPNAILLKKPKQTKKGWVDRKSIKWQKWFIYTFKVYAKILCPSSLLRFHFRVIVNKKNLKLSIPCFSLLKFVKAHSYFLLFVSCSQGWLVYPQEEVGVSLGMLASQPESGNKVI